MTRETAKVADINLQLHINASPEVVWRGLVKEIGKWWPAEFYAGGEENARTFTLEAEPGGRMYESYESGGGLLWAHVIGVEPNAMLQVHGSVFPSWGGPTEWFGTWKLEAQDGGTLLTFNEGSIGVASDKGVEEKGKGWQFLANTLKAHVEGQPAPEWS